MLPSATTLCSANQNMSPSDSNHSPQVSVEQQTMNKIKTATRSTTANGSSGAMKVSSAETMEMEHLYSAHNYHPLPVVFARASGAKVWDPEGREYLDFLSAYSAVNQGHCHPKIVKALVDQASTLTLSSRAFYNDMYGQYAKFVTEYFGYDMVLPMNTGAEAVETGIKLARRWGYMKKGIPAGQAIVFSVQGNFHGRTTGVVSMSTDPESRDQHGPYLPLVGAKDPTTGKVIRYNHIDDLQESFERHSANIAGLIIEPIQGEAGIVVPDDDYFPKVRELCTKHNVLLVVDEIQTGIARTGKMLCVEHYNIRPDVILLGKALSGGAYPVSAVLADKDIMLCFQPGTHGSTYGGNPLACAVAIAALKVVKDENLVERAAELGEYFRSALKAINSPLVETVRGKGLLNAIVIDETKTNGRTAWQLCLLMKCRGLLAKPTHENIIRLAPPLVISKDDLERGIGIIKTCLEEFLTAEIPCEAEEQSYHPTMDE